MSVEELILSHLKASGPVKFDSIVQYVHEQHGDVPSWNIAGWLNGLIRNGQVHLYDTGESFDSGPHPSEHWAG